MKHLFLGSRDASENLLRFAMRHARDAIFQGDEIIVGDANGVDAIVIYAANEKHYANIIVHGCFGKLRNKTLYGKNIAHDLHPIARDRVMAQECDLAEGF